MRVDHCMRHVRNLCSIEKIPTQNAFLRAVADDKAELSGRGWRPDLVWLCGHEMREATPLNRIIGTDRCVASYMHSILQWKFSPCIFSSSAAGLLAVVWCVDPSNIKTVRVKSCNITLSGVSDC